MRFLLILSFALCLDISIKSTFAQGNSPTYLFENFLSSRMNDYPSWIISNKLDPTTVNPSEFLLLNASSEFSMKYLLKIRDEQMFDYASIYNQRSISAQVDTKRQFFYLTFQTTGSIQFKGKYSVNGTTYPEEPFMGEGQWTYTIRNGGATENISYRYNIPADDHVAIPEDRREYSSNIFLQTDGEHEITFDGILNTNLSDFEQERVKTAFQKEFELNRFGSLYPEHPTASILHRYLTEAFKNTTYNDIIGGSHPPTEPTSPIPIITPTPTTTIAATSTTTETTTRGTGSTSQNPETETPLPNTETDTASPNPETTPTNPGNLTTTPNPGPETTPSNPETTISTENPNNNGSSNIQSSTLFVYFSLATLTFFLRC